MNYRERTLILPGRFSKSILNPAEIAGGRLEDFGRLLEA